MSKFLLIGICFLEANSLRNFFVRNSFGRRKQHNNRAGISTYTSARYRREIKSPPASVFCSFIHNSVRIAGPSRAKICIQEKLTLLETRENKWRWTLNIFPVRWQVHSGKMTGAWNKTGHQGGKHPENTTFSVFTISGVQ